MKETGNGVGLSTSKQTKMHVSIHEDNAGCIALAKKLPPECTAASKHYAIKTHWILETCILLGASILKIDIKEQLGDICTKWLPVATFQHLKKKLMGF